MQTKFATQLEAIEALKAAGWTPPPVMTIFWKRGNDAARTEIDGTVHHSAPIEA